jgi:superfamily II DNA or RNA helicase
LVEQPTGSGKTLEIVTLVAMHFGHRFSHAVIAAPQEQIEQGFVRRDYCRVSFPPSPGVATTTHETPAELIWGARQSRQLGSVRRLTAYLRQTGQPGHALACTHAALNQLSPEKLPADLSRKALFIDEAHHASADGLSQVITLWRERGGQLLFFTATPYRGDGRTVRLDGMRAFRRSLAEHMAEGFAPRHLESEIVALGQPGDAITTGQFTGEEAPPSSYFEGLVAAICRRWREDGKPKTIVRVPPMQGGRSGELVGRLMQALASQGARVLDATGTDAADQQRFLTSLEAEKSWTYATSAFDVMVGIQRVLEGTDWPVCSAVYCVGMPGSLNTVVQFLGRAMRLKGEDYPAEQRDRARLVFFVPCGGGTALTKLSLDHSRHALLTCCFLADHEVGQEWIVLREVRRGIEAALGSRAENPAAADAENEADEPLDPQVRAEVELVMAAAREQIVSRGEEPTVGEVVQLAATTRPDLPVVAFQRVAAEILVAQTTDTGAAVREKIHQEVARRLRIDPMVKKAMAEAFAVVLEDFRDVTLSDSVVLGSVGRQVHGVTGGQMREFAERLRDAAPRPLTEEQILAWADAHYAKAGTWPGVDSGAIEDAIGETWRDVDRALRKGLRSLPGGLSLSQLLAEKRGARNRADLDPLTEEQILGWADAHYQRAGEWPALESGIIQEARGETWKAINHSLRLGSRSLAGGSSIAKLLEEKRGVRNLSNLPLLTEQQILTWADEHFDRTGEWPTVKAEPLHSAPGETWSALNASLEAGRRGLPGESSLAKLLAQHRGARKPRQLPSLTEEQILEWADRHFQRTGGWPAVTSGSIVDCRGETWMAVNQALERGHRGLSGGSSLAKLLAKHRDVRNRMDLPSLGIAKVLDWADAAFQRTGEWPNQFSGAITESPGDTWAGVNFALKVGSRGLPGGCSLAQLLSDHRGVRNRGTLANLSIEQILIWADAYHETTGNWPKSNSGAIPEAPGETWGSIQSALFGGLRGLPGGLTLAQLLQAERGVRNLQDLPPLTEDLILAWAETHYRRNGSWPKKDSGPIESAPGETWNGVQIALLRGRRGLPGGSSLAVLLRAHRKRSTT